MNQLINDKISVYPRQARDKFIQIRDLIYAVAQDNDIVDIEETLKWGQPSYLCKSGSTIRVDWQPERPDSIDVFFNCKTKLVETFKEVFSDRFTYRANRVIEISLDTPIPSELEVCILMALDYHRLKKLPLLGA